jgi:small subunit ribosomal protein S9
MEIEQEIGIMDKLKETKVYATGRRKGAIARVWLSSGTGKITVNNMSLLDYFGREILKMVIEQPLEITEMLGKVDVMATVSGGGKSGQAGAMRLGISRALVGSDSTLKTSLRQAGLITRDPREKERKKYGLAGARKRYQYSKR